MQNNSTPRRNNRNDHPEYVVWTGMRSRCLKPKNPGFRYYGGRGITICARWRKEFWNFLDDMGSRPTPEHEIDRIDNDAHYSCGHCDECLANKWPANCRWATKLEQANNKSYTVRLTCDGLTRPLRDWARSIGVDPRALWIRIVRRSWDHERAIKTPFRKFRSHPTLFEYNGKKYTIAELAKIAGIKKHTMYTRVVVLGMSVGVAVKSPKRTWPGPTTL